MTTLPKDPKDPWQEKMFKPHGTTLAQTLLSHAWVLFLIYCEWKLVVLTWLQELLVQNIIPNSILRNTKQREKLVSIPCPVERPSSPIKINSPHDIGGCNDHHPRHVSYVKTTSEPRVGKFTRGPRWAHYFIGISFVKFNPSAWIFHKDIACQHPICPRVWNDKMVSKIRQKNG